MCRIAVLPKGYHGEKIVSLLDHLEKAMGGDGNGFGWFDAEGVPQTLKGLNVPTTAINKLAPASDLVLYHTRKTSAGETNDDNTQPFVTVDRSGKPFLLCHNGTWQSHTDYKKILLMMGKLNVEQYKDWSDTHFMAWLIETQGEDRLGLPTSGVWIQQYSDHAIAYVRSGDFQAVKLGKKWVYASEFPKKDYEKVWDFKSDTVVYLHPETGFKVLEGSKAEYKTNYQYSYTGPTTTYYGRDLDGEASGTSKVYYYDKDNKRRELFKSLSDGYGYPY